MLTYSSVKFLQTTSSEERRHTDTILQQKINELNTVLYQSFKHSALQRWNLKVQRKEMSEYLQLHRLVLQLPNSLKQIQKRLSSNLPFTILFEDFALGDVSSIPYQSET